VKRFRGGLVCKAHRRVYHSILGSRVMMMKKKKKVCPFLLRERVFSTRPRLRLHPHSSHSHATFLLEWCDKIKLSNLLLPRKSGNIKSLQLPSTARDRRLRLATQDCNSREATMGRGLMAPITDRTTRTPSGVASPVTTKHAAEGSVFVDLRNAGI
jgi:hypothetical protein